MATSLEPDSRIEKLALQSTPCIPECDCWEANQANAQHMIEIVERAGLLVVDPADPAVIDRVARELVNQAYDRATKWDQLDDDERADARDVARAVLAALGGDQ